AAAVGRLDDGPAALLGDLSLLPDGWSADQAAAGLSATPAAVVRDVHALMLRGLVRRLPGEEDGAPRFGVLNLVRQLAAERAASLVPATALVST
ncbi:hypothetical protein ACFV0D_31840, partial [Streptomyces sp. NPDC059556]